MGTTALFANQRQINIRSSRALIEQVLTDLGSAAAPMVPLPDGLLFAWQLQHGSAQVTVSVVDQQPFPHFKVTATVLKISQSTNRLALCERLLAENMSLMGAAFALSGDHVLLLAERSTLDLDYSEIMDITKHVLETADHYDDLLIAEYC
jgi:hypothetical protein